MSVDLSTRYLGFDLPHPFMPGASPLVDDMDLVRGLEDAGASAIVMHSLFEEQIVGEELALHVHTEAHQESYAEATSYLPEPRRVCARDRRIPGTDPPHQGGRLRPGDRVAERHHAVRLDRSRASRRAGRRGRSRDQHLLPRDGPARKLRECRATDDGRARGCPRERPTSRRRQALPVSSRLSRISRAGWTSGAPPGLVLFNRFYQPDIDIENLDVVPSLRLSDSSELLLRLRWLAVLSGRTRGSLAVSGGVHTSDGRDQGRS